MNRRNALARICTTGAGLWSGQATRADIPHIPVLQSPLNVRVRTPTVLRELALDRKYVLTASFSPDGTVFAACVSSQGAGASVDPESLDGSGRSPRIEVQGNWCVALWDSDSGNRFQELTRRSTPIHAVSFNLDGTQLIYAAVARFEAVPEVQDNMTDLRPKLYVNTRFPRELRTIKTGNVIKVSSLVDHREILSIHDSGRPAAEVALGRFVTVVDQDRVVRTWATTSGLPLQVLDAFKETSVLGPQHTHHNTGISRDSTHIVSVDNQSYAWDLGTSRNREVREHQRATRGPVAFSPDGSQFACWSTSTTLMLWDFETLKPNRFFEPAIEGGWAHAQVNALAFSQDGARLVSAEYTGQICTWDVSTGRRLAIGRGPAGLVRALSFMPSGRLRVASGGTLDTELGTAGTRPQPLRIWDIDLG